MGKVIGIIAIKGGVGKTTISSSLASELAYKGKKVLLIDANYSAPNLGLHMDIINPEKTIHDVLDGKIRLKSAISNKYGVDVIPGSYYYAKAVNFLKLKDKINSVKENYDFVIIDSSPSLNEEILSTMLASEHLFVVTTPDYATLTCSLRAAMLARQRGRPIEGIILNKTRDPGYELSIDDIEEATEMPVIAKIPDDISATRSLFMRMPLTVYSRKSKAAIEIGRLADAFCYRKEKVSLFRRLFSLNFKKEEVNRQRFKEEFYKSMFVY